MTLATFTPDRVTDWRALLPAPPQGAVLCLGGAGPATCELLAATCRYVDTMPDAWARFNLVTVLHPAPAWALTPRGLLALAHQLLPGGVLYLEVDRRAHQTPTGMIQALAAVGFAPATCYWPRPDFDHPDFWLPLGDAHQYPHYLKQLLRALSVKRRAVRGVVRMAVAAGQFERLLPGYAVVARRTGAPDPHTGRITA